MKNFLSLFAISLLSLHTLNAQETRGLKLIAKDAQGIPQEVSLYQNYQLHNAVNDAKGIKAILSEKFVFDKFLELYNELATKDNILKTSGRSFDSRC